MATQKDVKNRISSVKNIQKITRAMEMVAAARLRRAEQRIEHLRPYAGAIRRMTRRVVEAVENIPSMPILEEHDEEQARRPAARHRRPRPRRRRSTRRSSAPGTAAATELEADGKEVVWFASGRRGVSSLEFPRLRRRRVLRRASPTAPRTPTRARSPTTSSSTTSTTSSTAWRSSTTTTSRRSRRTSRTRRCCRSSRSTRSSEEEDEEDDEETPDDEPATSRSWLYEPEPEEILQRLIPDYVEISIYEHCSSRRRPSTARA